MNQKIGKVAHEIYSVVQKMDITLIITPINGSFFYFERHCEQRYMCWLLRNLMEGLTWRSEAE